MGGENLVEAVIAATGLPQNPLEKEFHMLLEKHGKNPEEMTLEDLREVMVDYLQTVMMELHEDISA